MRSPLRVFVGCLSALCLFGCPDDTDTDETGAACDPLQGHAEEPLTLGAVVGVGRDAEGVLYVIDHDPSSGDLRAFESDDETLVRLDVIGSGASSEDGVDRDLLSFEGVSYSLVIERDGTTVRMARTLLEDPRSLAIDDLEAGAELEMIESDAVESYALRDLSSAGSIVIEYLARAPGGELLVVLHPDSHEAIYEEFRLFYGDEEALRERDVRSVQRQRDGGSTHLLFDLDGVEADAYFPVMLSEMGLTLLQATLEADGEVVDLERLEHDAAALDGARFECLR